MAVTMRSRVHDLAAGWQRRGHDLGFGAGITQGYATLGRIGFAGRYDYAAVGSVTNVAARLCARATDGQILVTQRVVNATEDVVVSDPVGDLELPGLARPVRTFNIKGLHPAHVNS
jgi:class 3 adenylate cyclase